MIPSTRLDRLFVSLAVFGALAVLTGVALGIAVGPTLAGASPIRLPAGTLGVGEETVPPITSRSGARFELAEAAADVDLHAPSARAMAPVAPPAAARASATRATTSRSAATAGGWRSARASWYGPGFYGRKTASGAVLTEGMMNVAHKSLPFGTRIQFEHKGRSCVAVVNDRGPFVAGRVFDLGPGTATALGFSGVGTVRYRILGR